MAVMIKQVVLEVLGKPVQRLPVDKGMLVIIGEISIQVTGGVMKIRLPKQK